MELGKKLEYSRILRERYEGDMGENGGIARAYSLQLQREAELESLEKNIPLREEDCTETWENPLLGKIKNRGGKNISFEKPWEDSENKYLNEKGFGISFWWRGTPGFREGECFRMFFGSKKDGPILQWEADHGEGETWYKLSSHGNFGGNFIHGGNFRSEKIPFEEVKKMEVWRIIMEMQEKNKKIEAAKKRLQAANLRLRAAERQMNINGYLNQMEKTVYPGQEEVCAANAGIWAGHQQKEIAEAELLEAEADAMV